MQQTFNKTFIIVVALIIAGLLWLLAPILTPFLAGGIIAYLVNPAVERLIRWKVPRLLSVTIVFLIVFLVITILILLLIPLFQKQITALTLFIPKVLAWFETTIVPWIEETGIKEQINIEAIKKSLVQNWSVAGGAATVLLKTVLQSGLTLVAWVTNLLLIPVVTFYLLRDWHKLLPTIIGLVPKHTQPTVKKLAKECDEVLSAFFRGQLMVMISLGIVYAIGLNAIGLQIGLIIGVISGLLTIVPYLGFIVGIVSASIAAFIQFGTITSVLLVWLVFAIGQVLDTVFLTPKFVGDKIGLHPVAVIFAVLAGGVLFGFFGVLLALPIAAVTMVLLRFLNARYHDSRLYHA